MNSLIIGICATVLSTVIGTLAAYAIWKRRRRGLPTSLYLSLLTPEIVTGISLLALFQWMFRFLQVHLGMHTVILAHVSFCVVYAVIVVSARLKTFDPCALKKRRSTLARTSGRYSGASPCPI